MVLRPSFTVGSNGVTRSTAALKRAISSTKAGALTPSILAANPSKVSAVTFVTRRMRYSSLRQMGDLGIEDLPSALARLIQHFATVTGVGVVAEVLALIHKPPASTVDQNAERIRVFLEVVANVQVPEFRGVHVPAHSVATRPVTARGSPDVHCHANAVTSVEPLCHVPSPDPTPGRDSASAMLGSTRSRRRQPRQRQRSPLPASTSTSKPRELRRKPVARHP